MATHVEGLKDEVYLPPEELARGAHCSSMQQYNDMYTQSIDEPEAFWGQIAKQFHWKTPHSGKFYDYNFDAAKGKVFIEWMRGATTNVCYNALDRHVENGDADRVAFYWEGNEPADDEVVTYGQLLERVRRCSNALRALGVRRGDPVAVYLPMIPELAVTVLACARIGAVHSVVFGGFSADALADRILDAKCEVIVTSDGFWRGNKLVHLKEIADHAVQECAEKDHTVRKVLVVRHLPRLKQHTGTNGATDGEQPAKKMEYDIEAAWSADRDVWWTDAMKEAAPDCEPEWMDAEDPLFMLYTSGSTGKPKGVLHTTAGYMLYAATTFKYSFDYHPEDVYWCTADVGWITGHSYVVYGPLLNRATSVMFEGSPFYPNGERPWQIVDKYAVSKFYTAPTAIRALMRLGDELVTKYSRRSLKVLATVGEPINPEAWLWYHRVVGDARCAVVDTFWQTETGGHVITPLPGATPTKPGSACRPFFGVQPALLDEQGVEIHGPGEGYLVFRRPWPGIMRTVFGNHERFETTYFKKFNGFYCTGDGARRDEDGYIWVTGRIDDMLNVSGHLLSTAQIESALIEHPAVAEAAVVAVPHSIKGEAVYCFVTNKQGTEWSDQLKKDLILKVRERIGAFAAPDYLQSAPGLPKTRSGKIMRRVLRKIAVGDRQLGDVSTMADSTVIDTLFELRSVHLK
ncbi:acetyl-coenzyme A synthetase, cytoplasmic-like [Amphibalanus amphitrite]|uniref:acetyl-coenzyme A synthetase, cytoplasmic-like n=1 Tax=Amphibalanus amphitrite TaxID=1232801 RepID=UPI001C92B677|nr:acetyl-coenzyme A synthetase, cytoplasmic-like [Amphibalanus amphitrite]XP_043225201.1 acetyl-coenzyme A synthetase, cytoplasmic-like [Amphibalanus amphitrite]XP_043225202.1 acetyl-coenzyme A synthetase, cytoplasmic-like [Amphibalanus amphitrite]XP_043225203.1 acetyl-coenzyme A synthetase, cytoplasmic-like [Amphibalanus amphitrite]